MNSSNIVQKLWNYCNGPGCGQSRIRSPAREYAGAREKPRLTLRDDGMSYGEYPSTSHRAGSEQLTYALTLALSQRERGLEGVMADERTKAPYNQTSPVPEKYGWPPSPQPSPASGRGGLVCDGDELFDHYRHTLEGLRNSTITWLDVTNRSSLPSHA